MLVSAALFLTVSPAAAATPVSVLRPPSLRINVQSNTPVIRDFTVGPARFLLSMQPGEQRTVDIELTNREGESSIFDLTTEDFIADPEHEGTSTFFGEDVDGPFSARRWLAPEIRRVQLNHADRAFIRVMVSVPKDADPGDHQAALIVTREEAPSTVSGIAIVSRVAALFIITVQGDVVEEGSIEQLTAHRFLNWSLPVGFRLTAKNSGSVRMLPSGTVEIRNIFGIPVDSVPFNDWVVLRDSTRSRDFSWLPRFALGRYTAVTDFTAFNGRHLPPVSTAFWVIPLLPVLLILLVIFVVSFAVQYFFSRFEIHQKKPETPKKKAVKAKK